MAKTAIIEASLQDIRDNIGLSTQITPETIEFAEQAVDLLIKALPNTQDISRAEMAMLLEQEKFDGAIIGSAAKLAFDIAEGNAVKASIVVDKLTSHGSFPVQDVLEEQLKSVKQDINTEAKENSGYIYLNKVNSIFKDRGFYVSANSITLEDSPKSTAFDIEFGLNI